MQRWRQEDVGLLRRGRHSVGQGELPLGLSPAFPSSGLETSLAFHNHCLCSTFPGTLTVEGQPPPGYTEADLRLNSELGSACREQKKAPGGGAFHGFHFLQASASHQIRRLGEPGDDGLKHLWNHEPLMRTTGCLGSSISEVGISNNLRQASAPSAPGSSGWKGDTTTFP